MAVGVEAEGWDYDEGDEVGVEEGEGGEGGGRGRLG